MRAWLASLLLLASITARADETRQYTVTFQDTVAGAQKTTLQSGGRMRVEFSYRDNGRGPDLFEDITLASDGTLTSYRVKGKSTFGAPVAESFTRKGSAAEWRAFADSGKTQVSGPAIYVPVEGTPQMQAVIARAIARQPEKKLAALPGGELSIEPLKQITLDAGGRTLGVTLYAINGLAVKPEYIWLTHDDELRFFASLEPGLSRIIEKGWETHAAMLEREQVAAESDKLRSLAQRFTHQPREPILFRNVRVFDSRQAKLGAPADVYVAHGRIAAIYEASSTPREAGTVIDGTGRVLMPGLFDMHTHEDSWNTVLQIAGGVTTSRDMGNDNAVLADLSARIESGEVLGPRIVATGYIEGESPFSSRGGFVVRDLQGAKDAIDWYAQHGFRQVKLYNSFLPEWVEPTASYAHQRGLRVSGHIPAFMRSEQAVRAGYDEIQHINQLMLTFFLGPKDDTRTLARFYLLMNNAHSLDLSSARVTELVQLLKERGTVLDLTLATFEAMFNQMQGEMNPSFAPIAANVPISLQREWRTNSTDVTAGNVGRFRASWARMMEFTNHLYREGIPFVAGTDEIAGFTLHRELELYVKAGIPAAQALQIATWNGAKYCGLLDELGSVEPHKRADLILIDGDPTADISNIRRISLVMKNGAVFFPAQVYEALGIKRFTEPAALQTADKP